MNAIAGQDTALAAMLRGLMAAWAPDAPLDRRQRWRMRRALLRIAAAQGVADPLARIPVEPGTLRYQRQVIVATVTAVLCRGLGAGLPDMPPFTTVATDAPLIDRVVPARLVGALDANAASIADLAALPGLGPVSARRIVARRDARGPFTDLADLRRAARISRPAMERARPFLFPGTGAPPDTRLVAATRVRTGGMAVFLDLWQSGEIAAPHLDGLIRAEAMVVQLEHCAKYTRANPAAPRLWAPDRGRLRAGSAALIRADGLRTRAAQDAPRIAPVFSSGYLPMLESLIAGAQTEIAASMFYFTVGDPEQDGDPGDRVIAALAGAMARGVTIRLILDDDVAPDRHGARLVNEAVLGVLERHGLPVRRDHLDITSHAKMIAVDRRRVLLGSHNWTASAFFRYQETSVLVDSSAFGAQVAGLLDRRWALLAPPAGRIVPVELLDVLPPDARAAILAEGLADGPDFVAATRLKPDRVALAGRLDVREQTIDLARRITRLMQAFRISETLARALVADGLDAPSEVARAGAARIARALTGLPGLPPPFAYREILPEVADWLAREESDDG